MSKKRLVLSNDELSQLQEAEAKAARLEARTGAVNTYWHKKAARIRASQKQTEVKDNGK